MAKKSPVVPGKTKKKLAVGKVPVTVAISRELSNAIGRYQMEYREQHPHLSRRASMPGALMENLMRKGLGMPQIEPK
jgi:hypothetical protein